jgi:hypothetical protein
VEAENAVDWRLGVQQLLPGHKRHIEHHFTSDLENCNGAAVRELARESGDYSASVGRARGYGTARDHLHADRQADSQHTLDRINGVGGGSAKAHGIEGQSDLERVHHRDVRRMSLLDGLGSSGRGFQHVGDAMHDSTVHVTPTAHLTPREQRLRNTVFDRIHQKYASPSKLFLQWDDDKSGDVSVEEFRTGVQSHLYSLSLSLSLLLLLSPLCLPSSTNTLQHRRAGAARPAAARARLPGAREDLRRQRQRKDKVHAASEDDEARGGAARWRYLRA